MLRVDWQCNSKMISIYKKGNLCISSNACVVHFGCARYGLDRVSNMYKDFHWING